MGITFIYVTHDQEEGSGHVRYCRGHGRGKIQQIGTPEDIYNEPKNAFVADFIGESNIIDGIMRADGVVEIFNRRFQCLDKGFARTSRWMWSSARRMWTSSPRGQGQLKGTVTSVTFKGMQYDIIVDFYGFKWLIKPPTFPCWLPHRDQDRPPDGIHVMKRATTLGCLGTTPRTIEGMEEISDADFDQAAEDQEAEHEEE